MRKSLFSLLLVALLLFNVLWLQPVLAQERKGTITGHATDTNHDPLVGARVELQPQGHTAASDAQGQFTISDLPAGKYTLTISYVGFKPFSGDVTVTSGGVASFDVVLEIETVSQQASASAGQLKQCSSVGLMFRGKLRWSR
jgi:hypothetical protein